MTASRQGETGQIFDDAWQAVVIFHLVICVEPQVDEHLASSTSRGTPGHSLGNKLERGNDGSIAAERQDVVPIYGRK